MAEMNQVFVSVFDQPDERKIGRAFAVSVGIHGGALALMAWWMLAPAAPIQPPPVDDAKIVFLQAPGPGGGGGGSPAPAPPKKLEIPKPKPAPATPVAPQPVPVTPPPPELLAPVQTDMAALLQSTGVSTLSAPPLGGGGRGKGSGPGDGDGLGPGKDRGFGGDAFMGGDGIDGPTLLKRVPPTYTTEAMRAKIQGVVVLDAVVLPNGTVGDIRIARSLDRSYGLDERAIAAARGWLFQPGTRPDPVTRQRKPVAVLVRLELEFRLH